jgi:hypothetical protein
MASLRRRTLALMAVTGAALGLPLLPVGNAIAQTSTSGAEAKGAQTYCFLRTNGNDHGTSWNAAYALIKRQSASLFKTSPEHASVMITEAVVQNPGSYPDCGRFLGDLFRTRTRTVVPQATAEAAPSSAAPAGSSSMTRSERYGN